MDITIMAELVCLIAPLVLGLMAGLIWWNSRRTPGKPTFYPTDLIGPVVFIVDDLEDRDG